MSPIPALRWPQQKNVPPTPCTQPPQLPVPIWKRLSVPLTFAPSPFIHPLIYSANLAVQTLRWLWGRLRPPGLGHPVPPSFSPSCLFNPDPPSRESPLCRLWVSSQPLGGVSVSDKRSGQLETSRSVTGCSHPPPKQASGCCRPAEMWAQLLPNESETLR